MKHTYDDINSGYNPKVSVVMIAYNVDKYIREAIESVLKQQVNFDIEIIIGDDCSQDETRQIALDYQKKEPKKIKVLLPSKNQGLTPNCIATHNACKGEYIALLDADDFWTDETKLQRQVDFLDSNPNFSACAHQATIVFDDIIGEDTLFGSIHDAVLKREDMLQHRKFHTSSLVYRRKYWEETGGIPSNILSNERAIYPMLSIFGPIMYWKESMCIYRRSTSGISSRITAKMLATDINMISWLKGIDSSFPYIRYRSFLHFSTYTYPKSVPFGQLCYHYLMFVFLSFSYFPKNLGDVKF